MSVYGRLGFDFDTSKFGDSITLQPNVLEYVNNSKPVITSTVESELVTPINRSDYFINPVIDQCNQLLETVGSINYFSNYHYTYGDNFYVYPLYTEAQNYIIELNKFISHTNNISGYSATTGSNENIPHFSTVAGIATQVLLLTNATDQIEDATPMLGAFTSLFIGDDLVANNTTLANDIITLNNSVDANGNSNISSTSVDTINEHLNSAREYILNRRLHDWNFYANSLQLIKDYNFIVSLVTMGQTQKYLANNLIGTTKLKTLINS